METQLEMTKFMGCDLSAAVLLINADCRNSDLAESNLKGTVLQRANFDDAILDRADSMNTRIIKDQYL
jgi:uncharacterized protein YjbI with pentapeptide repeats